jgi:hypothetical protein
MNNFKVLFMIALAYFSFAACAATSAPKTKTQRQVACPYPAEPVNWLFAYCAPSVESDDEIDIVQSKCVDDAQADMKSSDTCAIKKKYKSKICERIMKDSPKRYKDPAECLKDPEVKPFFAGE